MPLDSSISFDRRDLEARLGRLEQLAGLQRSTLSDGPEAGVEQVTVRTGAGLAFTVLPTCGLDIARVEFCGTPISWHSPAGDVHPAGFDSRGLGWLRTTAGGMLMTCGLTQVGSPCQDGGEELGLHGRAHHTPARQAHAVGVWTEAGDYEMRVGGVIEEAVMFGARLRLTRVITARLGVNRISIHDVVENCAFAPAPHMLLYHFNFGYPLLDAGIQIDFPSRRVIPREADLPLDGLGRWTLPDPDFREQVYYHEDLRTDPQGWTRVSLRNPRFPLAGGALRMPVRVELVWDPRTLPRFVQWKMPGTGEHVLGIEPANCHVAGRAAERAGGTLVMLPPGEALEYRLELSVGLDEA